MPRIILAIAIAIQILWVIAIGYPPSIQQIDLGIGSALLLWLIRLISLASLTATTHIFSLLLDRKNRLYYWILIFISPAINVLWLAYPVDCIKILFISFLLYLVLKKNFNLFLGLFLSVIILIGINHSYLKQGITIFSTISPNQNQTEVMQRFSTEDTINPHINLPLWFRRIGYNKYFLSVQNTFKEAVKFWDQESVFFQEVHPLNQKSFVMFFWPQALLLLIILWIYATKINTELKKTLLVTMLFSWTYFILTNDTPYKQLIISVFWISILLAWGIRAMLESKTHLWLISILIFATTYGVIANFKDRLQRPLFWLDNRPVAFQLLLENAKKFNYQNYSAVYMTNLIGPSAKYCKYYLHNCTNFQYDNFNLSQTAAPQNTLYLGFIGNYMGPKNDNDLKYDEYLDWAHDNKINILSRFSVRDTVAFRYGNDLIIAEKK